MLGSEPSTGQVLRSFPQERQNVGNWCWGMAGRTGGADNQDAAELTTWEAANTRGSETSPCNCSQGPEIRVGTLQLLPPSRNGSQPPQSLRMGSMLLQKPPLVTSRVTRRAEDGPCPLPLSKSQVRTFNWWDLVPIQDLSCKGCC